MSELESEIRRYVLENAVKYGGRPNTKSVLSALLGSRAELRSRAKEIREITERIVSEVERLSLDEQKQQLAIIAPHLLESRPRTEAPGKELPPLPGVEKWPRVVMRLAPFPSGPLHIGNARMVVLNDYYVRRYNGELILVFDDTIGSEEKQVEASAYDTIPEGLDYLGVKYHKTVYKSDRLDIFYRYAEDLIDRGLAYVCTCDSETWRTQYKAKKRPCPCRTLDISNNRERWERMLNGTYGEREAALRLKTGMDDPDPAMRDHVMMRITDREHPRVGTRYRVWPLLEYSWGIDDHELGISHIIRGKDLVKEGKVEQRIWSIYGWQQPELIYYGRLDIEGIKLSKSKSRREVLEGIYTGWDDPRTWSLQSLAKRGITAEALRKVILDLGLSLADISISVNALYAENRKLCDADAPRFFFVQDPVWLEIDGFPSDVNSCNVPVHPDFPERGHRVVPISRTDGLVVVGIPRSDYEKVKRGMLIRLKDLANITIVKGRRPRGHFHSRNVDDALKVRAPIIHWIPRENVVPVQVTMVDGQVVEGLAEPSLQSIRSGQFVQFERCGFVKINEVDRVIKASFAHK